jgi:DNA polymerase-3 subunit alpha
VATVLADAASAAKGAAKGPIQLCLMDPGLPGDVEMDLGQDFPINPQIKGAIKSLDGVLSVEEV